MQGSRRGLVVAAVAGAIATGLWLTLPAFSAEQGSTELRRQVLYNSLQRELLPHCGAGAVIDVQRGLETEAVDAACHISYELDLDDGRSGRARAMFEAALRKASIDPASVHTGPTTMTFAPTAASVVWWSHLDTEAAKRFKRLASELELAVATLSVGATVNVRYDGKWFAITRTPKGWRRISS